MIPLNLDLNITHHVSSLIKALYLLLEAIENSIQTLDLFGNHLLKMSLGVVVSVHGHSNAALMVMHFPVLMLLQSANLGHIRECGSV